MSSFSTKGILSILVCVFLVSSILYASPPSPPDGFPAGGLFARYFSNIIGGSLGTGTCPPGRVIVGYQTGSNSMYGLPICKTLSDLGGVSIDTSALSGTIQTLSGMISTLNPSQWSNYPNNTLPTGIYYPFGNVGIGTLPDMSKKLTVLGDTTLSGSVTLPKLPTSSTDATNKAYVDAAVASAGGGGGGGSCYYVHSHYPCVNGYSQAPGFYYNSGYSHYICCPSSTSNSDLNYCPAYRATKMIWGYVYSYSVPDMPKGTTTYVIGYNQDVGSSMSYEVFTCE